MDILKVNVCYHPTTILIVDDKKSFLDELKLELGDKFNCKFYTNPQNLLKDFNEKYQANPFINRCISIDNDEFDHVIQDINLRVIRNEIMNQDRFNQVSTLITDHAMPGMTGLECCQAIRDRYVNKILLTGQADNDLAVDAFNKNLINKFIQKSALNISDLLIQAIVDSQEKYFATLSEKLYGAIPPQISTCLNDPVFANMFHLLCRKNDIIEYYLTDEQGGFLLLDINGNPSWLAVANESHMTSYWEIASGYPGTPEKLIAAIKKRQMLPYFYSDTDLDVAPAEWEPYMHKATRLEGKAGVYYYAYIEGQAQYEVGEVFPYRKLKS